MLVVVLASALAQVAPVLWQERAAHCAIASADGTKRGRSVRGASVDAEACTPGYDPCIPPGPDVDCAGGSGNGPRYVKGPIRVTGSDPYGLDRDGDGVGCQ